MIQMETQTTQSVTDFLAKIEQNARKARIISLLITGLIIIAAVVVLTITVRQTNKAQNELSLIETEKTEAAEQLQKIQAESNAAKTKLEDTQKDLKAATEKLEVYKEACKKLPDTEQREVHKEIEKVNKIRDDDKNSSTNAVSRIYIQILNESQRVGARDIQAKLNGKKYRTPGIELVDLPKGLEKTLVKYFDVKYKKDADDVVALLKSWGINDAVSEFTPLADTPDGQLEIWFSSNVLRASAG